MIGASSGFGSRGFRPEIDQRLGAGFGATSGFPFTRLELPVDPALIIADWISDLGIAGPAGTRRVSSWRDARAGNVVSQATAANQPLLIGGATPSGRPALQFDGLNDRLTLAAFNLSAFQDVDFWTVSIRTASGTNQNIVDRDGPVRLLQFVDPANRSLSSCFGNVGLNQERESVVISGVWRTMNIRTVISQPAANESQGYFDRTLTRFDTRTFNSDNTNANCGNGQLRFGARVDSLGLANFFGGSVARVAFLPSAGYDRTAVAQFLADLYGTP